jgi:hypothetical protein
LFTGEYLTGVAHQKHQQVELSNRQHDRLAVKRHRARIYVKPQFAKCQNLCWSCRRGCHAAQHRFHPCDHFARAERFGNIIVGAEFEAYDPVGFFAASRQHNDRDVPVGAQALRDFKTVQTRQHQVEHH